MGKASGLKNKNSGFSLMELLVVVAIISILAGLSAVSISLAGSRDAERCAKMINSALESARMSAMSQKGEFALTIDFEKATLVMNGTNAGITENEKLPNGVTLYLPKDTSIKKVEITFDKSTGKVKKILEDGADVTDTTAVMKMTAENPTGKKATVVLVKATGKHFVEYQ